MKNYIIDGVANKGPTFLFSHGAGAPMDTGFMNFFAQGLSNKGFRVVRFEFDYMLERRKTNKRRPPDRLPKLLEAYLSVIKKFPETPLIIGGKSMGGRVASLIASEYPQLIKGCICLGYPFHPPRKPEKLRTAHLEDISTKTLICQGERDRFGTKADVNTYILSKNIHLFWAPDGDHDLKPRKSFSLTEEENWTNTVQEIIIWAKNL